MKLKVLLNQNGTNVPVPTILEDTNGLIENELVTFNYDANGEYYAESNGLFIVDKTSVIIANSGASNNQINSIKTTDSDVNRIYFNTKEVYWDYDNNFLVNTYKDDLLYNTLFQIDVLDNNDYTPFELSKLAHAQSILFGSGSDKLIALALKIGAPRPRP